MFPWIPLLNLSCRKCGVGQEIRREEVSWRDLFTSLSLCCIYTQVYSEAWCWDMLWLSRWQTGMNDWNTRVKHLIGTELLCRNPKIRHTEVSPPLASEQTQTPRPTYAAGAFDVVSKTRTSSMSLMWRGVCTHKRYFRMLQVYSEDKGWHRADLFIHVCTFWLPGFPCT